MPLHDLDSGDLQLRLVQTDQTIHVHWMGKANARRPAEQLNPWLDAVVAEALEGALTLEFHFEAIEHFNSSTIAVIMQLAQRLERLRVPLVLSYNADLKWQKLTFRAFVHLQGEDGLLELRSL